MTNPEKDSRESFLRFALLILPCLAHAVLVLRPKPAGIVRLLLSLPVILFFTLAPLSFKTVRVCEGAR